MPAQRQLSTYSFAATNVSVRRVRGDAGLLAVAGHLLALDIPGPVLAADDPLRARRADRAQHLHLLVPHRLGGEVDRRLHRGERDQLEQVVLEHVADRAGLLVERRAALDPDRLGDGDLHVVDELAVPDRLEDPVREPKREHVLHRLLAQVVVDAEDLALVEVAVKLVVQPARARAVGAEGLLDDQARPALPVAAAAAELLDEGRDRAGRDREVEDAVACGAALPVEPREEVDQRVLALVGCEVGRDVVHPGGEPLPDLLVDRVAAELAARPPSSAPGSRRRSPPCGRRRRSRSCSGSRSRTASE